MKFPLRDDVRRNVGESGREFLHWYFVTTLKPFSFFNGNNATRALRDACENLQEIASAKRFFNLAKAEGPKGTSRNPRTPYAYLWYWFLRELPQTVIKLKDSCSSFRLFGLTRREYESATIASRVRKIYRRNENPRFSARLPAARARARAGAFARLHTHVCTSRACAVSPCVQCRYYLIISITGRGKCWNCGRSPAYIATCARREPVM